MVPLLTYQSTNSSPRRGYGETARGVAGSGQLQANSRRATWQYFSKRKINILGERTTSLLRIYPINLCAHTQHESFARILAVGKVVIKESLMGT